MSYADAAYSPPAADEAIEQAEAPMEPADAASERWFWVDQPAE
jgi:hypothetical protein